VCGSSFSKWPIKAGKKGKQGKEQVQETVRAKEKRKKKRTGLLQLVHCFFSSSKKTPSFSPSFFLSFLLTQKEGFT